MVFDVFFTLLLSVFAMGSVVAVALFIESLNIPARRQVEVKAIDILAREGYMTAPRTRRRKVLV